MNARTIRQQPTEAELEILEVLWRIGPATVRSVHDARVEAGADVGYTTTLKLMQIMAEKGQLVRDTSARSHVYSPAESSERVQSGLVQNLIDRAFSGSASELVLRALSDKRASDDELAEVRRLLEEIEARES